MLQDSCWRVNSLDAVEPIVVCHEAHRFLVAEQLREIDFSANALILEPAGRGTAPAIALAAIRALEIDPNAVLLVLPTDHYIRDVAAFSDAVRLALSVADPAAGSMEGQGKLVTFGVVPSRPETGYGYIRCGSALVEGASVLTEFVEKPDKAMAEQYIAAGNFLWNSGIFLFRADRYMEALREHNLAIHDVCVAAMADAKTDLDFLRPSEREFLTCLSDSIDCAVLEHTNAAVVVNLDCGWSDIGAWSALWEVGSADKNGNVIVGDVLVHDTYNSYLHSETRLVTATGVDNLVVVETADAILVADKDKTQGVKDIVAVLKGEKRDEATVHQRVFRPWGSYELLVTSDRFQVKRIVVSPGQKLSLQKHFHRAEHWVVVKGTAEVTRGDEVIILHEDQSTYIPLGATHCLANPGKIPLELIEIQSGSYLGEDDIVRLSDVYGR